MKKGNGKQEEQAQMQAQMQAQQQRQQEQAQQQQYVDELVSGKKPIPNALVGYLVEELKNNSTELKAVAKTLQQAQQVVEKAQQRAIELRGIGQKYAEDIIAHKDDEEDRRIITPATIPQPVV